MAKRLSPADVADVLSRVSAYLDESAMTWRDKDGTPQPNAAMRLKIAVDAALDAVEIAIDRANNEH